MWLKAQYSVLFVLCFNWLHCINSHHTVLVCLLVKEIIMIHIYTCIYTSLYTYYQFSEMTFKNIAKCSAGTREEINSEVMDDNALYILTK